MGTTLRALARQWIDDRQRRTELRGRSVAVEAARLCTFLDMYGDDSPNGLNRALILEWQAAIGHLAPATRRAYVGALSRFLRWLQLEGHVSEDLTVHLVKVREPRRAPRALPARDVSRLFDTCTTPRGQAILGVMVGCGLRCVEVSRLDLDDYDPDSRTLFVKGKADHERVVPLPEMAQAALDRYIAVRGMRPGPMFLAIGSKGDPSGRLSAKWISKKTALVMREAGVHVPHDRKTAHALRHTCASDVLDACHDLRVVKELLGHESLQSTEIYLRRADLGRLREAMEGRSYLAALGPTMVPGSLQPYPATA